MSGMLFLLFVQSLFYFGVKEGNEEGYYGEKTYLHISFTLTGCPVNYKKNSSTLCDEQAQESKGKVGKNIFAQVKHFIMVNEKQKTSFS